MQKKIIALALATLAGSAFAQSNVTIYGIADMAGVYQKTDGMKALTAINSGVLSTSRIGFKGVEDLGNGLKALFTLEYGLQVDNNTGIGAGGAVARQQFVGLTGGFGTAVAGRLQTTGLDFTVAGTALGGSTVVGTTNVLGGSTLISAGMRANNAVAYISPSFGGLSFALNFAKQPLATETVYASGSPLNNDNATLASVSYDNGPLTAGLVYGKLAQKSTAAADDVTEWGIRGGYDFGVAKVQATFQNQNPEGGSNDTKKYVLSVSAPVSAKAAVIGEFGRKSADVAGADATSYTLASTYSLSKRTTAYAAYNNLNPEGGNNTVKTLGLGLRHAF